MLRESFSGNTTLPTAVVRLRKEGEEEPLQGAGTGDGPVDAAYETIKALTETRSKLVSYTIQSITGGTDAMGEVIVTIEEDHHRVTGRGHSTDIIVASAMAYVDAINRLEFKREKTVYAQGAEAP